MKVRNVLAVLLVGGFFMMSPHKTFGQERVKTPNVSGQFYTSDQVKLSAEIDAYLQRADISSLPEKPIEVLIAPHAGYMYSGPVAAYSFKAAARQKYKTVVVLGFSHSMAFNGISVWGQGRFRTPLGDLEVDQEFAGQLLNFHPKVYDKPEFFEAEHSLEVELPFLQKTLTNFKIVPVIMGQPSMQTMHLFAKRLAETVGSREDVLIVVSTDLSHYHDDALARKMDDETMKAIAKIDLEGLAHGYQTKNMELCGLYPVMTSMFYARERGITESHILRYGNSGDVMADKQRVVGYGAAVYFRGKSGAAAVEKEQDVKPLTKEQKKRLLEIARTTIEEFVRTGKTPELKETDPRLSTKEGAFVTIHKNHALRGCIGNIIGRGPLYLTVRDMAIAAATEDPRFSKVKEAELKEIDVEVSVLSVPKVAKSADEIVMGVHGVIVSNSGNQGLFLPQVAVETGWSKEEFMNELCSQKAGLPRDCWKDPQTEIQIFTADVFSEKSI